MRWLALWFMLWSSDALAQSREVLPTELSLTVEIEAREDTPLEREMVMITIRGVYRRHITRETLVQPDFDGFNWAQLGPDSWTETRMDGRQVKLFTRRMALYPARPGTLTIGAFTHKLTLTDAGDDWFDHQIASEPITLEVAPAPDTEGWWFPVRRLQVSDQWSNAPDQLQSGQGVLRIVRVEALGATPEMIPPMPELTSPSAMIFPHPERRLVELTPEGPVTYAFWRWTIRPTNDVSTVVEPLRFSYFDTANRVAREVEISAQRVAYGDAEPSAPDAATAAPPPPSVRLHGALLAIVAGLVTLGGIALGLTGRQLEGRRALHRFAMFDPLRRALHRAARKGDARAARRAAAALIRRDGPTPERETLIRTLDRALFDPTATMPPLRPFARAFAKAGPAT